MDMIVNSMEMGGKTLNRLESFVLESYELLNGDRTLGKGLEVVEQRAP